MYTLYVQMPTETSDGDISICTYDGKYASFFFNRNTVDRKPLDEWFEATERRLGFEIGATDKLRALFAIGAIGYSRSYVL